MSETTARPPGDGEPYDPYRDPIVGSGEHADRGGRTGEVTNDPLDTSLPYEPGLSGFGGTGRDAGPADDDVTYRRARSGQTGSGGSGGAGEQAKQQASRVGQDAKESGQHVKGVAQDEAAGVAQEAKSQAKGLLETTRSEVSEQASQQTKRAASGLSNLGEQLQALASGDPQEGQATDLVRQAADRVSGAARWMEGREPADLLADVQSFARRRPGAFIAIAAGVGLVAGRLTRGVAADAKEQREDSGPSSVGTSPHRDSYAGSYGDQDRYTAQDPYSTRGTSDDVLGGRGSADPEVLR